MGELLDEYDYTCPTKCVEQNHPGREHDEWVAGLLPELLALSTTGAVRLDRWCTAQEAYRPIDLTGTCDNCSAGEVALAYAIDVPARGDSEASEPWLCKDCSDLGRFQALLILAAPYLLDQVKPPGDGGLS